MSSSVTSIKMKVNQAEQFKTAISAATDINPTTLYLTYGKVTSWANDAAPDTANSSIASDYEVWLNMIGGKKILGSDVIHVIPRYNWTANTKYYAYDHMSTDLYDKQFYIMTSDYNVYKCLANNSSSNSTVQPTAVNPTTVAQTSDGYIWKYMYTVSDSEQLRFTTAQYIPVKSIPTNDGSLQAQVQTNAVEGAIYSIILANTGSGYSNSSNMTIQISGDGQSATATANVNVSSGKVSTITMTNYGLGYTFANVSISGGGGSGAIGRAIITPFGGHGSDALYELGGSALMFNPSFKFNEGGKLPTTNDFRQIAIVKNPLVRDGSAQMDNTSFSQAYTLTTVGSGNYVQDEILYQGVSVASAIFSGRLLSWDSANGIARLINTLGAPTSQSLIGANTSTSRFVSNIVDKDVKEHSGYVLYLNNLTPITRSSDQIEDFKLIVKS
jgi:hypothetical protein